MNIITASRTREALHRLADLHIHAIRMAGIALEKDIITMQEYDTYAGHVTDASFSAAQAVAGMKGITTLGSILDSEMPIHTTHINLTQQDL